MDQYDRDPDNPETAALGESNIEQSFGALLILWSGTLSIVHPNLYPLMLNILNGVGTPHGLPPHSLISLRSGTSQVVNTYNTSEALLGHVVAQRLIPDNAQYDPCEGTAVNYASGQRVVLPVATLTAAVFDSRVTEAVLGSQVMFPGNKIPRLLLIAALQSHGDTPIVSVAYQGGQIDTSTATETTLLAGGIEKCVPPHPSLIAESPEPMTHDCLGRVLQEAGGVQGKTVGTTGISKLCATCLLLNFAHPSHGGRVAMLFDIKAILAS